MTYNRKRKIRIIKGLRKIFKINKYNSEEISRYGSYALLASYWPKPWKFTLTSILCKYKKQISKNEVNEKRKAATEKKNAERFHIDFWRLKNVKVAD